MTKASDNEFPSVLLAEQGGDPSTPASGFWRAYAKSDGLYVIDDAGATTGPFGTGGGGGLTQAYEGYNTAGASTETMTTRRTYWKQLTPAADCLITNISAYLVGNGNITALMYALAADSSGAPGAILAASGQPDGTWLGLNSLTGWVALPMGVWVTAGTYWAGVMHVRSAGGVWGLNYDVGTDGYQTQSGDWINANAGSALTGTSRAYSIRANTIR